MTSQEVIRDAITRRHHPPIPGPSRVESHQAKQLHLNVNAHRHLGIMQLGFHSIPECKCT
jgi:hypothetical protein